MNFLNYLYQLIAFTELTILTKSNISCINETSDSYGTDNCSTLCSDYQSQCRYEDPSPTGKRVKDRGFRNFKRATMLPREILMDYTVIKYSYI